MNTNLSNPGTAAQNVTVTIALTGPLPDYVEAKGTGVTCSAYVHQPNGRATFTCSGSVAAKASLVVTVSSGSKIKTAGAVSATANVQPGGASTSAVASFA